MEIFHQCFIQSINIFHQCFNQSINQSINASNIHPQISLILLNFKKMTRFAFISHILPNLPSITHTNKLCKYIYILCLWLCTTFVYNMERYKTFFFLKSCIWITIEYNLLKQSAKFYKKCVEDSHIFCPPDNPQTYIVNIT